MIQLKWTTCTKLLVAEIQSLERIQPDGISFPDSAKNLPDIVFVGGSFKVFQTLQRNPADIVFAGGF